MCKQRYWPCVVCADGKLKQDLYISCITVLRSCLKLRVASPLSSPPLRRRPIKSAEIGSCLMLISDVVLQHIEICSISEAISRYFISKSTYEGCMSWTFLNRGEQKFRDPSKILHTWWRTHITHQATHIKRRIANDLHSAPALTSGTRRSWRAPEMKSLTPVFPRRRKERAGC